MDSTYRFRVLGRWEAAGPDGMIPVPPGRLRILLSALLLTSGGPTSVPALTRQLWPDRAPERPRGALYTYITRLRKLLGRDLIRTSFSGGYELAVPVDVDLFRFRDLVRRSATADSAEAELDLLRSALRLWRGRPFADVDSAWLELEVVPRLTEEWLAATERRQDLELAAHRHVGLIPELRELTAAHPTRESLWARLITCLHRAGWRAEALEAFHQARITLRDELGLDPGTQLREAQRLVLLDTPATGGDHR
ncbi:AfsR/SARP family transcriptional regulator [Dactylosporangium sp. CA-092794]|uniref:AfsR/SARP family transcriptional regulator n=1 Tax=Dactylosporangium sp. CA-092794 TaxID=3239929 RepID=UPI003D8C4F1B